MIIWVILFLTVALIALLTDWKRVLKRFEGKINISLPKKAERPRKVMTSPQPVEELFSFDTPVAEEEVVSHGLSDEVQKLLAEADIHFRKGELKAAEKFYLQAAAKDPRCSKAYSRLGVIYLENGEEWEDAEAAFRQALKTDPQNGFILNNLGLVLYHQDKFADAIRHFELAVRQDELNAARHANLGMANMAMRQYAKAESAFKRALKLAPNELEYKDLLAEAMEKKQAHKALVRR